MTVFQQIQRLVDSFDQDIQLAKSLESPNAQDDLAVKAAIVGFSSTASIEEWAKEHSGFLKTRIEGDYSTQELAEYGENSENIRLFFALAIGYLLGLYQRNEISDPAFKTAQAQIPGLIMLHLERLTAHRITSP